MTRHTPMLVYPSLMLHPAFSLSVVQTTGVKGLPHRPRLLQSGNALEKGLRAQETVRAS